MPPQISSLNSAQDGEINIRIAGTGGQGVIRAGLILSEALVLEGRNVVMIQSYGPETRGGASRADIVVSDDEISYPGLRKIDYLVVLHYSAYREYLHVIDEKTTVLYDSSLVDAKRGFGFPFTELSVREFESPIFANMIAVGSFCVIFGISQDWIIEAIRKRMNRSEDNIRAFRLGLEIGGMNSAPCFTRRPQRIGHSHQTYADLKW
ncbi:2-oxoacid:acceptor oxidoreductase family protein [Archaeoglobus neptunius]|uniref:2-oxoacid:acceptor oxidoreductase family protein n=1 Tax=Archaeoglobus neptunius TaxID=2798580 RepID=UPI0019267737|nr:2-oxoacid:acceptor oxidoreductase family protein [Archaeoglobus neptunius]